jgi:Kef-type K+ transport system membrane component KefB
MSEGHLLVDNLLSVWWIALAAGLAPVLALITRRHVPDVVWLLAFGALIGPHVLGLADQTEAVEFLRELGMGFLFLLAGFEVNIKDMRDRQGKHAALTWGICAVFAFGAGLLLGHGEVRTAIVLALVSTSTALGTLLPILKDSGMMPTPLGRAVMTHGAFGELLPVLAMSLLLSTHGTWASALILLLFFVAAIVTVVLPARFLRRLPLLGRALMGAANTTMQTTLRLTVFVLVSLMLLTAVLELDVALGAFAGGLLLNRLFSVIDLEHAQEISHKVEVVGFSFLIPVFFVTSGMNIDVPAVLARWPMLIGFVLMIAVARGLIVFLREKLATTGSGLTATREQLSLGLYTATGLPIIVAVTQVAAASDLISQDVASVMVTGGAITVLAFPLVAGLLTAPGDDGRSSGTTSSQTVA